MYCNTDVLNVLGYINIPHWSQQITVHQYAFPPVCIQDSTCRWQGHTANPAEPLVNGRNGSGCTDKSVSINSHHVVVCINW